MSDLLWRLANRREMVNYGNGDVRDIPDEDCVEAAAELTRLREQIAALHRTRRWNIDEDGSDLLICVEDHEKGEKCNYVRYVRADSFTSLREQCEAKDAAIEQWKSLAQQYQRERAELADKLNGTPCAEIRWRHEIDAKDAEIERLNKLLYGVKGPVSTRGAIEEAAVFQRDLTRASAENERMKAELKAAFARIASLEATVREMREALEWMPIETRPEDSNADAWHLFLSEYLDARANSPSGLTFMAVQIAEAIDNAERRGASSNLPCGHHVSCLVKSVESDSQFCGFCDIMSQRNDAETMEERYRSERDSIRKALDDRHAADKKAWRAIMRATGKERGLPDNKEVVAFYVAEVERLEKERDDRPWIEKQQSDIMRKMDIELFGWKCAANEQTNQRILAEADRDSLRAKLDRAKEAIVNLNGAIDDFWNDRDRPLVPHDLQSVRDLCGQQEKCHAILSELSGGAPAQPPRT